LAHQKQPQQHPPMPAATVETIRVEDDEAARGAKNRRILEEMFRNFRGDGKPFPSAFTHNYGTSASPMSKKPAEFGNEKPSTSQMDVDSVHRSKNKRAWEEEMSKEDDGGTPLTLDFGTSASQQLAEEPTAVDTAAVENRAKQRASAAAEAAAADVDAAEAEAALALVVLLASSPMRNPETGTACGTL
jgi:hypothetical protein